MHGMTFPEDAVSSYCQVKSVVCRSNAAKCRACVSFLLLPVAYSEEGERGSGRGGPPRAAIRTGGKNGGSFCGSEL